MSFFSKCQLKTVPAKDIKKTHNLDFDSVKLDKQICESGLDGAGSDGAVVIAIDGGTCLNVLLIHNCL